MDVCTVIARNYLAAARVLALSLREHHPESRLHVLVIDSPEGYFDPADEPFEVVRPGEIGIPDFERMAGIYEVLELATAVKPWLLRGLLREADEGIVYLDPDIRLYAPIGDVFEAVREHGLALNPHNTEPMPRDGMRPNEQDILIAGAYNLGFIGLGHTEFASAFLDWWGERLETDCIVDPERGFFVDQRWVDLVPGLAPDFHLIRDPGFNVAYWNLPTRTLAQDNGRYTVNGEPLRLFHFSGFKPTSPHLLSRYQDRVRLADDPVLTELCRGYTQALLDAGHDEASAWPYGYATTHSGIALEPALRASYRKAVGEGDISGSLFERQGEQEFLDWSNAPGTPGGAHGVTRYLVSLYDRRPDLRVTYPDLDDARVAEGFLGWARRFGTTEVPIPEPLLPDAALAGPEEEEAESAPPPRSRPLALNVAGYLNAELGVGEVARQLIAALDAHRVPVLPVGLVAPNSRQGHEFAAPSKVTAPFDVNLICVNADGLPGFAEEAGREFFAGRYSIGVWWWELSQFPAKHQGAFELLDEVWVGTRFIAEALGRVSPVPVFHVPLPIQVLGGLEPDRETFGVPPNDFVFLFSFDFNSVFKRKNPLDLVDAFTRAFAPGDGVRLVVKSINGGRDPDNHDLLRIAAEPHPHVQLIDHYLSVEDNQRLLASCDAYVSLHRSEGFGIGMAEALLRGKPVVATAYGGNTDYLNEDTGYPVSFTIEPVGEAAWPYEPDAEWAQPDLDDAARQMRAVVERQAEAMERVRRAQHELRTTHSPEAAGERMLRRLESIHARRGQWRSRSRPELPQVEELRRAAAQGPAPAQAGPLPRVRRLARRTLLRVMRPYTAHADAMSHRLIDAVQEAHDVTAEEAEERTLDAAMATAAALADARRLSRRVDELEHPARAGAGDEAERLSAGRAYRARPGAGRSARNTSSASLAGYPEAPEGEPWSAKYVEAHRDFVARELGDLALIDAFRTGAPLPGGFGSGFDERVVEFPWIASRALGGRVLDAGSALNHLHVLLGVRPRMDDLHVVTLAPEEESFPELGVSYVYADLRELPFQDGVYDRVVCISTLDHLGLDNDRFGADAPIAEDPQQEAVRAVYELRRVLRPGGDLYLTLPVGRGERFDWVRSFTCEQVDELLDAFGGSQVVAEYFRHDGHVGWRRADRAEIGEARYRDHFSSGSVAPDRVVAAEAVACVHLVRPG